MASEIIDFRLERDRHAGLIGREDVFTELDRFLLQGELSRGWVLVLGNPGMGKSALLSHYLARLERDGHQVPHHFLRRGRDDWDRPEVVVQNLAAQVEALFPEHVVSEAQPESPLRRLLQRISDAVLVPDGKRLILLVDGLDEAEGGDEAQPLFERLLPHVVPQGVYVLCASRPMYSRLAWLESKENFHCIDLHSGRWSTSSEKVVRGFWESAAQRFQPPLAATLIEEAVQRAQGNMLYATRLAQWLQEQPVERRRVELLPRGLDAFLESIWGQLQELSEEARSVSFEGLGLMAAAREALPLSLLATLEGWDTPKEEQYRQATRSFLMEQPEDWEGEPAWQLFHESFRAFITRKLGTQRMQQAHHRLAEHFGQWPLRGGTGSFRRYALRHGVTHWLKAGEWERARALCTDIHYLEEKCRGQGVTALEEEFRRLVDESPAASQRLVGELHRAVQTGSHWLRRDPGALALLIYNRLRCSGLQGTEIEQELKFRELPALRLRHPLKTRGAELRTLKGHEGWVHGCAISARGRRIVSASRDATLRVWDLETGQHLAALQGHKGAVKACAASADGRWAVSASEDRTLKVWDLEAHHAKATLEGHEDEVNGCAVTADARRVVSASSDRTLRIWDLQTGRLLTVLQGHEDSVKGCAVTADGRRVVSCSKDTTLRVWDLETGQHLRTLRGHEGSVKSCTVTADGQRVISSSADGTLRVWNLETGEILATLQGHKGWVNGCAVTVDGRRVVSASNDTTLKVWDLERGRLLATLHGHERWVHGCAVTPDGRWAVSASDDKTLKVWDLEEGQPLAPAHGHEGWLKSCALTADGRRAVSASKDTTLKVWDLEKGQLLATLSGHQEAVRACAVTADGRQAVSASKDATLQVWDLNTGKPLMPLRGHEAGVNGCAVTADGRRVVSSSADKTLRVWDRETGESLARLEGHEAGVNGCAVTGDGRRAVSASDDATLQVWDLNTGKPLATLRGHEAEVRACAVTADGQRVVSASADTTLRVWELETGRLLNTLQGHEDHVKSCAVVAAGQQIVSASKDGTLKAWDLDSGQPLRTLYGNSGFECVAAAQDTVCAGDSLGNLWILEATPARPHARLNISKSSKDVGIVIALQEEFDVFMSLLPAEYRCERDENTGQYDYLFEFPDSRQRCVCTLIGAQGLTDASLHTERLIAKWEPRTVVMLGIAAGIHEDVKIGDIVIAKQVDSYMESAKARPGATPDTYELILGGKVFSNASQLINDVQNFRYARKEDFEAWRQLCEEHFSKLVPQEEVRQQHPQELIRVSPEILTAHLASGPVVGAAQAFRRWLQQQRDRNLKALDMESAGLMAAASSRDRAKPTLVIRGISDSGDENKSTLDSVGKGALRRYAMHNATQFLWTLLRTGVLPRSLN